MIKKYNYKRIFDVQKDSSAIPFSMPGKEPKSHNPPTHPAKKRGIYLNGDTGKWVRESK